MAFDPTRAQTHDRVYIPKAVATWQAHGARVQLGGYEFASPRTLELSRRACRDGSLLAELFANGQFDLHVELPRGLILFNEVKGTVENRPNFSVAISSFRQMQKLARAMGADRVLVAFFPHAADPGSAAWIADLMAPLIMIPDRVVVAQRDARRQWQAQRESWTFREQQTLRREFPDARIVVVPPTRGSNEVFVVYERVRDHQPFPDAVARITTGRKLVPVTLDVGVGPCAVCRLARLSKPQHFQARPCAHSPGRRLAPAQSQLFDTGPPEDATGAT
jgi:hypothetical protein